MRFEKAARAIGIALAALCIAAAPGLAQGAESATKDISEGATERSITLAEAVALALENNEGIRIERALLESAEAGVVGAQGAYDPLLQVDGGWRQSRLPVNSSFSGAPLGRLAPTTETTSANASVSRLLPTGGTAQLRGSAERGTTNGIFDLLSPSYGTGLGLELRQPLLRDRRLDPARFGIQAAAADRSRAAAELERQVTDTVAAVESSYWQLVAIRRALTVREEAIRLAQEQLSDTESRIQSGASPETEISQPRSELERRRGELFSSRELASRAENALKLLIFGDSDGAAWGARLVPAENAEPTVTPVDVNAAMAQALASRPELRSFEAAVERRRAETALAREAVRPALDAVVSYDRFGLSGSRNRATTPVAPGTGAPAVIPGRLEGGIDDSLSTLAGGDFDDARVGLVFSYPIGNRRARADAVIAGSTERQAELDLAQARKQVRTEVLDAAAALETAGQRVEAARAAREAAEVQLMAERERFGAGMSINFLVLTRQNDLSNARLEEISAQTDYRRAATELARVTGALLADRGIEIDATTAAASRTAP